MAAKLFKQLISAKRVPDQPVKDDPSTAKTTGSTPGAAGSVQELRSTSPSKANRASAAAGFAVAYPSSSSSSPSPWLGPDLGPAAGTDGTRRHSDASTFRGRGTTRIPGRTRADPMSFRGGSTRLPPGTRRDSPIAEEGRGRGGGGVMGAKNPRTEGLTTEGEGVGTATFCQPPIATEYSDPFDLRQQSRANADPKANIKAWSSEDDYSVPYEVLAENAAGHKPSELDNKKLPSLKPEPVLTAEIASLSESSPETLGAAVAATAPCTSDDAVVAENLIATIPENESEGSAAGESDNAQAVESEQKPDAGVDSAFDSSGPSPSPATNGPSQPPAADPETVFVDPSAGLYDDPWDLGALQRKFEEKLLKASLTPPPGESDSGTTVSFGSKEVEVEAVGSSKDSAEQIYDEPWDKRAENLHQSFFMAGAGRNCEVQSCAPDQIQKYRYMSSDPDCTHHQCECTPLGTRRVGELPKVRTSVRTEISSRHPLHSSFCALHSDVSLNSQLHNNSRHSSFQRGCETLNDNFLLEKESWYHGAISRVTAESRLRCHQEGSYLVRLSESDRRDYSLSVKSNSAGFMHLKIVRHDSGFVLGQFSQPFANIPHMILYYTINKLPIRGTEHITLSFPVSNELPL